MSTTDPFDTSAPERTIIKPKPRTPSPGSAAAAAPQAPLEPIALDMGAMELVNPLVTCAGPLLMLLARLRQITSPADPQQLRSGAVRAIEQFDGSARKAGIDGDTVIAARYVLCTAVDEAATKIPLSNEANWNKQSLLVQFHNETRGGEKVFQLLSRLTQDAAHHINLLELIYCVIALGFQGRYLVLENGLSQLDVVRSRLSDLIAKNRPAPEPSLSPHWQGQVQAAARLRERVPLWLLASVLALALALTWFGLRLWLNYRSDDLFGQIAALRAPTPQLRVAAEAPPPPPPPPPVAPPPRLARFLQKEIDEGLVTVIDQPDRSTVRLLNEHFFASGSAEPTAASLPVLNRIALALGEVKGAVLINGHTDNEPIRSLRYPSNWNLSTARAQAVMHELALKVDPARMRAEGKADAEPIAPNDTSANKAKNRRVEIVLLTGGTS